ncbi:MAG: hypothetical protein DRI44_00430 [Chlamydiae bacterium]|nr:MAG: hypothetical protein DRI44_00430 [Chlamydiota bacterium]
MKKISFLILSIFFIGLLNVNSFAKVKSNAKIKKPNLIVQKEAAIKEMTDEIFAIDSKIEGEVGQIINYLSSVKDSAESHTKVAVIKEKAILALANSVADYKRERAKRMNELSKRYPNLSRDILKKQIGIADERINKRIKQIVDITSSLTQNQNVKKYDKYWTRQRRSGRRAKVKSGKKISKEYKQNRSVTAKSNALKDKVIKGLNDEIDTLEAKNVSLNTKIQTERSKEIKEQYKKEIEANKVTIEKRKQQIADAEAQTAVSTTPLQYNDAKELEKQITDMVLDIEDQEAKMKQLIYKRNMALKKLATYKKAAGKK